jgi:hypothetical protein
MRNVSEKCCRENQNTFSVQKICAFDEIMWKNTVELNWPHMTTVRMRNAFWIPVSTYTESEYVILVAFPLQQWLHKRASMLRYTYIAVLYFDIVNTVKVCRDLHLKVLRIIYVGWL